MTVRAPAPGDVVVLSVHGPAGVVDLTVPVDALLGEVARVYAAEARLASTLPLVTRSGEPLQMATTVADAGLVSGSIVVAVDPSARPASGRRAARRVEVVRQASGPSSAVWLATAVGMATAAGWAGSRLAADDRWPVIAVLLVTALIGCLPMGTLAAQRALAAPAFAAAACFAHLWDPLPERWPTVLGAAALAGAIAAALARALAPPGSAAEEGLKVWMLGGAGWFVLAGLGAIVGVEPQVVWSVVFLIAVLAARWVPEVAIDVPDQFLLDLERLAVTAWSARERPSGRRGRIVVPLPAVATIAARGARTVDAAAVAIAVVAVLSGALLLSSAWLPVDRIGARCLVGFGGASLVLMARSYRHAFARSVLRTTGVVTMAMVAAVLLGVVAEPVGRSSQGSTLVALAGFAGAGVAAVLVLVAVVLGRGWRSAWWSRRAEVAEALCGAATVAAVVVATGLFRHLWEIVG